MSELSHPPKRSNPQSWIAVYNAQSIPEAQIVAGRLQNEGIPAFVHYPVGSMAIGINLGEILVLVHPNNYDTATAILFPDDIDELPDSVDTIIPGDNNDEDNEDDLE